VITISQALGKISVFFKHFWETVSFHQILRARTGRRGKRRNPLYKGWAFLDMSAGRERLTCSNPLTASERYAKSLLLAWDSGEAHPIEAVLDRTALVDPAQLSAGEQERFELVHEIGSTMKAWQDSPTRQDEASITALLGLLRHLARSAD
jgi:hypothetical protein